MKRKFTKLLAAVALLMFLMPFTGWGQSTYTKVTTAPADWSGTYVIVADESNVVFTGQNSNFTYGGYASVTISNGSVTGDYSNYEVLVEKSGDYYTMKHVSSEKYLGWNTGNNLHFSTDEPTTNAFKWILSTSSILNANDNNRKLQYNSSSPRFACYTSNQKVAYLYLKESGSSTAVATTTTIDATGITNTDVYTSTAAGSLTATVTETESGDAVSGATVTWTSSKENVATIDEDGVVTLVAAGTTTITASYAGVSGEFGASSATYDLTVTNSAPYVQPTEFEIGLNNTLFGTSYSGSVSGVTDDNPIVGTQDNVTVTYAGGGNHYVNNNQIRFYPSNKLTFEAPAGYEIKSIVFTADGTWAATITADGGSYNASTKTWTGSATSVLFTGSGSSRCDMSKATITIEVLSTDPSITANNVDITYDATGGNIVATINNEPDPAGTLTAAIKEGTTPTIANFALGTVSGNTVPFTCSANNAASEQTATVTLTYTYNTTETVTKDVTITQAAAPVVYTTIPEIFAAATGTETDVTVTFNNWVISAVKNNNAYLTDNAGNGLIIYASSHGFAVNDVLSGTASCILQLYNGSAELKNLTSTTTGLTVTTNGTVTEQTIAINSLTGVNTGALLHYDDLTYNGTALVDADDNTITPYSTLYSYTFENGKSYNVTGIYLQYNTTKEILPRSAADIEEVVSSTPVITADDVNIAYDATSGEIAYTITNPDGTSTLGATTSAEWVSNITVTNDKVTFTTTANEGNTDRTAEFTLTYTGAANKVVTVTQAHYVVDYAELPFVWDGGSSSDFKALSGVTTFGLGSDYASSNAPYLIKFDTDDDYIQVKTNERPGKVTIGVKVFNTGNASKITVQGSSDGSTFTDIQELTISATSTGTFTIETTNDFAETDRYVKLTFTKGVNVGIGPITIAQYTAPVIVPAITLDSYAINTTSDATDGSLTVTYTEIETSAGVEIIWCDENGDALADQTEYENWLLADFATGDINTIEYTIEANDGAERTAYFKLYGLDGEANDVYSDLVTVTQAAYVPPVVMDNYARFTGVLIEGDYLIVYDDGAMNTTVTNDRLRFNAVTVNDDVIATDDVAIIWHIAPSGNYWTIYNTDANAYAASTGAKNKAQMLADGTDDKALWTVSGTEVFEFVNKANAAASVNANLRKNGDYGFACYATATGGALTLYKKVTSTVQYDKVINGYNDSEGGYYLIASPIYGLNPANVTDMTDNPFDLYKFDQAEDQEWRNYEASPFYLSPGKGYLYAKKTNVTLHFEGMPYEGDGVVALDYSDGANLAGWNLIGNPFGTAASLDQPYYRLNSDGSALNVETESSDINVMEGVFVQATAADQIATFTAQTRNAKHRSIAQANIMISQNGSILDKAIVRFDNGSTLGKFQLNENSSKVFFTKNSQDYAIVCSDAQGEMPVNFKAAENGTYTIDFSMDNVEFSYLHLIDNKTGMDIDLLQTSSYTFEASKIDYASRFKLVFSTNSNSNSNDDNDFAFFDANGNLLILGNEGTATLQVIDITGRTVSNETFSGNYSKAINAKAGVYMLRLIQGNDVRTQKIVVR